MNSPHKYNIETANIALSSKGLDFLSITEISGDGFCSVLDKDFGPYQTSLQSLAPSVKFPLHRKRKNLNHSEYLKKTYVGKRLMVGDPQTEVEINDVFYGKDRGYKNRSFFFSYTGSCGHAGVATLATLVRHKKSFECPSCSKTKHGERKKENGVLKKRSSTYTAWVSYKSVIPEPYRSDFGAFYAQIGDKPYKLARVVIIDGKPMWESMSTTNSGDLNLIATAVRQAFRYSSLYRSCLENSRVETEGGTKYKCNKCGELCLRKDAQVDHIDPVNPIDGSELQKETLIQRIWTDQIQILDKKCHVLKSQEENAERRKSRKSIEARRLLPAFMQELDRLDHLVADAVCAGITKLDQKDLLKELGKFVAKKAATELKPIADRAAELKERLKTIRPTK